MILNSFRTKIALLSGFITGCLLIGSGAVLWRVNYSVNLDRLDREMRNLGQANLERVQGGDHWARLDEALKFIAGERPMIPFVLWVRNYDKVVYQSPAWPGGLAPGSFPEPTHYPGPNAPGPGQPPPPPPRRGEQISPANPALPLKAPRFYTRDADGKSWRIGVLGNPYTTLILAADMGEFNDRMARLEKTYLAALAVILVLVAGSAWLVARRALGPVAALTEAAERVTARGLDQRIPEMAREEEFNRLITVFNAMLDRLERSFRQATRFSADASHELKTPLSRLQVELEQALAAAPAGSSQQQTFASLLDEVCRLKSIVHKLLLLSLADAGRLNLNLEPVDLAQMTGNVVQDCRAQAPRLKVEQILEPGIHVNADPELMEQVLQNLATNAIKYNMPNGTIRFSLSTEADRILLRVANTGPGIPASDRERIFERFYRSDPSRSGRVDGAGLGLSLAREIVRGHGGDLVLGEVTGDLTEFVVSLPAHPQEGGPACA
ncbi:MAG: ATP-binding protein [Verrucomicrobiota bacterium]